MSRFDNFGIRYGQASFCLHMMFNTNLVSTQVDSKTSCKEFLVIPVCNRTHPKRTGMKARMWLASISTTGHSELRVDTSIIIQL